jgi:hypothetical protein
VPRPLQVAELSSMENIMKTLMSRSSGLYNPSTARTVCTTCSVTPEPVSSLCTSEQMHRRQRCSTARLTSGCGAVCSRRSQRPPGATAATRRSPATASGGAASGDLHHAAAPQPLQRRRCRSGRSRNLLLSQWRRHLRLPAVPPSRMQAPTQAPAPGQSVLRHCRQQRWPTPGLRPAAPSMPGDFADH